MRTWTEASTNLYELLKNRNLILYTDAAMRLALTKCVALETMRGWRIAKAASGQDRRDRRLGAGRARRGAAIADRRRRALFRRPDAPARRTLERHLGIYATARMAGTKCSRGYRYGAPIDSCEAADAREDGAMRVTGGSRFGRRRGIW